MARAAKKKQPAKAKAKAKAKTGARQKQPDWNALKVDWPQAKQAISLRIDQDVLEWFRGGGAGYQTRMNAVLRAFVESQRGKR
jgi:uncharacterized protein (DUF4415 family)